MKKNLLNKIFVITIILVLVGVIFSPIANCKKANEEEQNGNMGLDFSLPDSNEIRIFSLNENDFNLLESFISDMIQNLASEKKASYSWTDLNAQADGSGSIFLIQLISFIKDMILQNDDSQTLFSKKTLIISQGWSYSFNIFKNSKFEVKNNNYLFWHYTNGYKTAGESKTIIKRPDKFLSSDAIEVYTGRQMGFMYKPSGIYIYQKNMFPKPSYTLFIGFANNAIANAEVKVDLTNPLT